MGKKKAKAASEAPVETSKVNDDVQSHSVDAFVSDLENESPEPSPEAIAAAAVSREQSESVVASPGGNADISKVQDSSGAWFDPQQHAVKADGSPSFTPSGKFRRKRGTASRVAGSSKEVATTTPEISDEEKKRRARVTGQGCAEIMFRCVIMLGGDEWRPVADQASGVDERREVTEAFASYCEAKDITDLPPGVMLGIVLSSYALPRFTMPQTQERVSGFSIWIKERYLKFAKWRSNRAARAANRNDGKRKNDASESDSIEAKSTGPRNPSL